MYNTEGDFILSLLCVNLVLYIYIWKEKKNAVIHNNLHITYTVWVESNGQVIIYWTQSALTDFRAEVTEMNPTWLACIDIYYAV